MNTIAGREGQEGSILLISLLVLLGLTALGAAFMTTSKLDTQIVGNEIRYEQSLSLAEAGLNEAVARLATPSSPHFIAEDLTTPNPGWGRYIVLAKGNSAQDPDFAKTATDELDNDLDAATDEASESYPEVLSLQASLDDPLYYPWVKLKYRLDSGNNIIVYGDHDNNRATPQRKNTVFGVPVINITARGEQAAANRTIEVDLVRPPAFDMRACIYTEDDDFGFSGDDFYISGQDFDPATGDTIPGSTRLPAIVTTADVAKLLSQVGHQQENQIIGSGGTPDIQSSPIDLNLEWYIDTWGRLADFHYVGNTSSPGDKNLWGDYDNYHVIYVEDGNLTLKGEASGAGLLLVDGDLQIGGSFTWYGVIIVLGDVNIVGGGDLEDQFHIYGGLFANGVDLNTVAGNADIFYSSKAIDRLKTLKGVIPLSWNEK
jgi:hypothetical protein